MIPSKGFSEALNKYGYTIVHNASEPLAKKILFSLGKIVLETEVKIREKPKTYLSSHEAIPFHNDHPLVRYIAWLCIEQDQNDGASILVDTAKIVRDFTESQRCTLARVKVRCPELYSTIPTFDYALYNTITSQVFWAPWLLPAKASDSEQQVIDLLSTNLLY